MITTQYGSEVKILKRLGDGWVAVKRLSDSAVREWHVSQLRAETKEEQAELHNALYGDVRS